MEVTKEFSQQLALSLYESTEEFPVDLDDAWQWIGYKEKRNALDTLKSRFEEGLDYTCSGTKSITGGRSSHCYKLTRDCFKELGMISNTEKGKKIRKYFLECERIAKTTTNNLNPELLQYLNSMQREMQVLSARTQRLDAIDKVTTEHKGIGGIVSTEVEDLYPEDLAYTVREYMQAKGISDIHLNTMRKRAIAFYKQGSQKPDLPKKGTEVLFIGNNIAYLDNALKTVLGLD